MRKVDISQNVIQFVRRLVGATRLKRFALLTLVSAGLSIDSVCAQGPAQESARGPGSLLEGIRQKYQLLCTDCHGEDGRGLELRQAGTSIPDFSVEAWSRSKTSAGLRLAILFGKGEAMPPFQHELTSEEAEQMVGLLRSFAGLTSDTHQARPPTRASELHSELDRFRQDWPELCRQWETRFETLTELAENRRGLVSRSDLSVQALKTSFGETGQSFTLPQDHRLTSQWE